MYSPQFAITPELLNMLTRLEVIREQIRTCRIHPKEELWLRKAAIVSMVHHSTSIEGNILKKYEVQKVLEGKKVEAPDRDIFEVKNYKKALDWIGKRKSKDISERDILMLHRILSAQIIRKERSGKYRKESVCVVARTPDGQQVIRYTGPEHQKAPALVRDLCDWITTSREKKLSPIIMAAVAHAEIAAIHPFVDGNGRTARLLATLILYAENYDFRKLFALENYYNSYRQGYYKAIHLGKDYEERKKSDLTKWLEYFSEGFLYEMEHVLEQVKPFLYLVHPNAPKERIILSKPEMRMLDFLQEMNHITSQDVEDVLSVSKRTAQRYLKKLIEKGFVKKHGDKKSAKYTLPV